MKTQFRGSYANISLSRTPSNKLIIKKIFGRIIKIKNKKDALLLIQLHRGFQEKAKKLRIPVVSSQISFINDDYNKSTAYVEKQLFVHNNLTTVLLSEKNPEQVSKLVNEYLKMFQKTWESGFAISLDPYIGNFGMYNKKVVYFDFFPPRQLLPNGSFFDWPEPPKESRAFILARHFSPEQSLIIYAQLLRVLSKNKILKTTYIKDLIRKFLGNQAFSYIDFSERDYIKILKNVQLYDAYLLRIIAGELCYRNLLTHDEVKYIFRITHIPATNALPKKEDLKKAGTILLERLD
ncbi:hypothetical protein HY214_03870 [Candidatus Roizmanbacteria bacterium]|nr:hypothetical protein [Candidatus Roizmanbacteria bacterium]